MIEIEKPKIECVEDPANGTYGKFTVEPLERGYGITLGNALRRIMLSSLPGTAATSIKIAGVQHEFSTIPGVKEDVTEIVLNVKSLITRLHNTDGIKTVYIEAVGPCEVKAGDVIEVAESSRSSEVFKRLMGQDAPVFLVPTWMERDKNSLKGTVVRLPVREEIDVPVEEHLIVELYSK